MNMNERRRFPRTRIEDYWIELTAFDGNLEPDLEAMTQGIPHRLRIVNESEGGLCVIGETRLELGQRVDIQDSRYPSRGVVVWTCQAQTSYRAGIQFTQGHTGDKE